MFGNIRRRLKNWLLQDENPTTVDWLDCFIDGKVVRMAVSGVCGLKLQVYDQHQTYLIGPEKALNKQQFWAAWGQRSPGRLTWEDGTPFKPTE